MAPSASRKVLGRLAAHLLGLSGQPSQHLAALQTRAWAPATHLLSHAPCGVLPLAAHAPHPFPFAPPTRSIATSSPSCADAPAKPPGDSPPSPSTPSGDAPASVSSTSQEPQAPQEPLRISLQDAVLRLADAAVGQVEAGDLDAAIGILQEGVREFGPRFPDSPEVGELHNQAALLLNMQNKTDEAAYHAQVALDLTAKAFGEASVLTGHRQLRLGAIRVGQGQLGAATELLEKARKALGDDASKHEADVYLQLVALAGTADVAQVRALESELVHGVSAMKEAFGADSMVLGLAIAQHDRLVNQALGAQVPDPILCEALLKQHSRLLELLDPDGEELAIAHYKLATFLYTQDLLSDAGANVRRATQLLRAHYPEDHPLVVMCMHRLGMICAASGDHRAATQLLQASRQRYGGGGTGGTAGQDPASGSGEGEGGGQEGSTAALAKEAELGLALARFRAIDPQLSRDRLSQLQHQALAQVRALLDELAASIGGNHMLTQGAMRYYAQLTAMTKRGG